MKKVYWYVLLVCFVSLYVVTGFSAKPDVIGTTSAQFLKIGLGARQTAMGSAYAGVAEGIDTVYWNPGGLGFVNTRQASFTNITWFQDISLQNIAYGQPLGKGVAGLSIIMVSIPGIERYDANEKYLGTASANDSMISLSYGKTFVVGNKTTEKTVVSTGTVTEPVTEIVPNLSVGANLKIINSKIVDTSANTFALDIGGLYKIPDKGINIGAAIQNLGSGLKYIETSYPLPLNIKLGVAYNSEKLLQKSLTLAFDMNIPNDNDINFCIGAEYNKQLSKEIGLAVRAGFKGGTDLDGAGMGLGVGLTYEKFGFDIGYAPQGELGTALRITLSGKF